MNRIRIIRGRMVVYGDASGNSLKTNGDHGLRDDPRQFFTDARRYGAWSTGPESESSRFGTGVLRGERAAEDGGVMLTDEAAAR